MLMFLFCYGVIGFMFRPLTGYYLVTTCSKMCVRDCISLDKFHVLTVCYNRFYGPTEMIWYVCMYVYMWITLDPADFNTIHITSMCKTKYFQVRFHDSVIVS
jgi:hypothetical protein